MDYPNFRLDDQVAVVTGSSEGIGYGLAKALANAGAVIYLASPAGGLVTGELLLVDGGWTSQ